MIKFLKFGVCITILLIVSCNKLESELTALADETATIQMSANGFENGDSILGDIKELTRTSVIPGMGGTSFSWNEGDVSAVYSSGKGLTNFIIDDNSISEDGMSATFNGSGFTLTPNSMYYAFFPYNSSSLDKSKIVVNYVGQNMRFNGDYEGLSQYDYMWARGLTDSDGNVGFDFTHLGCVVEFSLEVPQTGTYTQVRFELESNPDKVSFIKKGLIDLTSNVPFVQKYNGVTVDSTLLININNEEGVLVEKGNLLKVYMMMAPQDLSRQIMTIRLIDNQKKWYSAYVDGKKMKAGYTYHYYVGENTANGGFSGTGVGLPDDCEFLLQSTYTHPQNTSGYDDIYVDGNQVYTVGCFGIRKLDYTDGENPSLVVENTNIVDGYTRARSVIRNDKYLYVNVRQNTWGANDIWKPQICYDFEKPVYNYIEDRLSNNQTINSFFKVFNVNRDITKIKSATIYKALSRADGYRNAIVLRVAGENDILFLGKTYSTRQLALDALEDNYTNNAGDYCEVDWTVVSEGANDFKNLQFYYIRDVKIRQSAGAGISYDGNPSPNQGHHSALFFTGNKTQSYAIIRNSKTIGNVGEFSYWFNIKKPFYQTIKCLLTYTGDICKLRVNCIPVDNGYSMSLNNSQTSKIFNVGEWYNVKVKTSSKGTSLYYRNAECSDWILISSNSMPSDEFDAVSIGISTNQTNAEVLIDDFYFNETDIDNVTYVNGKTYILDNNLSVVNCLNTDHHVTGLAVDNEVLIVSGLFNVKFYDVSNPRSPKWLYTYRPVFERDIQNVTTFREGGRCYAVVCCHYSGFMIWDITEKDNIKLVCDDDFSDYEVNGISARGRINCFSCVVNYPYIYATVSPTPSYVSTHKNIAGIMRIDISSFTNPIKEIYCIPESDLTNNTSGDPTPNRIARYRNTLLINNRDKGIATYDISKNTPVYLGLFPVGTSINTLTVTPDGRLFTGDDGSMGTKSSFYYVKIE